jgi:hypothetical protein
MFLPSSFTAKNRRKINLELVIFQKKIIESTSQASMAHFQSLQAEDLRPH